MNRNRALAAEVQAAAEVQVAVEVKGTDLALEELSEEVQVDQAEDRDAAKLKNMTSTTLPRRTTLPKLGSWFQGDGVRLPDQAQC